MSSAAISRMRFFALALRVCPPAPPAVKLACQISSEP